MYELAAASRRIPELVAELAIHRRAAALLGMLSPVEYELRTPSVG
ncbi:hypothetical protein [Streptomyces sp. NBC_00140]|nr:hypothetical protein [Streptomyces sp. NBC_00140]MCX5336425.1 hypothetical protein [Streptomyces sp. NBC_00140]